MDDDLNALKRRGPIGLSVDVGDGEGALPPAARHRPVGNPPPRHFRNQESPDETARARDQYHCFLLR